eukprot:3911823-Rhodomonas_salina.1
MRAESSPTWTGACHNAPPVSISMSSLCLVDMRLVPVLYPSWRFVPSLCPPVFSSFFSPAAPLSLVAAPAWRCGAD